MLYFVKKFFSLHFILRDEDGKIFCYKKRSKECMIRMQFNFVLFVFFYTIFIIHDKDNGLRVTSLLYACLKFFVCENKIYIFIFIFLAEKKTKNTRGQNWF